MNIQDIEKYTFYLQRGQINKILHDHKHTNKRISNEFGFVAVLVESMTKPRLVRRVDFCKLKYSSLKKHIVRIS